MITEQRKNSRYKIKYSAYVVFRPEFKIIGKIKDINKKGLACEFLSHKNSTDDIKEVQIDILLTNGNFYMPMLPCEIIYNSRSLNNQSYDFNEYLEFRRCGMKFKKLNNTHKQKLNLFLKYHVV